MQLGPEVFLALPLVEEHSGRRDENRGIALFSIDYFVINASLPR
jgi:hypothetical protein